MELAQDSIPPSLSAPHLLTLSLKINKLKKKKILSLVHNTPYLTPSRINLNVQGHISISWSDIKLESRVKTPVDLSNGCVCRPSPPKRITALLSSKSMSRVTQQYQNWVNTFSVYLYLFLRLEGRGPLHGRVQKGTKLGIIEFSERALTNWV